MDNGNYSKSYTEEGFVRFVTVNKHYIKPFHLGKIPDAPDASVPRFVSSLLEKFPCRRENTELLSFPDLLNNTTNDCVKSLYDNLRSSERWLPFILVSKKRDKDSYCIDPKQIADKVKGNANVYCLDTDATIEELNYYFNDPNLSIGSGMVRVYYNNLNNNPQFHRYFDERDFQRYSKKEILSFLINTFSRYVPLPPGSLLSFQDYLSEYRRDRIQRLTIDRKEKQGEIELWEEENSQLVEDKSGLEDDLRQEKTKSRELESQRNILADSNRGLNQRLGEMENLRSENNELRRFQKIPQHLDKYPNDCESILRLFEKIYPERIGVHEKAFESAKKMGKKRAKDAWEMLNDFCTKLYVMWLDDTRQEKNLQQDFSKESRFSFKPTDSGTTKDREISYNEKKYCIKPHLTCGDDLRLYFDFDKNIKKLIIGHFGEHLPTAGSRKDGKRKG